MPHRYKSSRIPATFYMNTFDYVVASICILSGLRILYDSEAVPASIRELPAVLTHAYVACLVIAGACIFAGLASKKWLTVSSAAERAGLWLAGTAFVTYAAASVFSGYSPSSTLSILSVLAVGAGCGIRAHGISLESKALLQALQETPRVVPDE